MLLFFRAGLLLDSSTWRAASAACPSKPSTYPLPPQDMCGVLTELEEVKR